ncbi:MAG: hypothetical protein AAB215_04805 [Planctomycetota bacterium]
MNGLVLEVLHRALAALRAAGCRPVLVGGLALQAWGRIRQTKDVDLLVQALGAVREAILSAAGSQGLLPDATRPVVSVGGMESAASSTPIRNTG